MTWRTTYLRKLAPALLALLVAPACDKDHKDSAADTGAAATASASEVRPNPTVTEVPRAPQIVVDATATAIGPERVMANDPDAVAKMTALLTGKPKIEGEIVDVSVMRQAKPSHVAMLTTALTRAKAKGVTIHSETRDKGMADLPLTFASGSLPPCTVVAYIGKDGGINVWTVAGTVAKKFNRGFAGPDMTLGTEGIRKAASSCDSPYWLISADDALSWGLLFDMATMAKSTEGGNTLRPAQTVLLTQPPVPGRKVALE